MAKVRIHYFSATGNTARAVEIFKNYVETAGFVSETRQITTAHPRAETPAEEDVFAFPTLGFAAPAMVKQYIKRLPKGEGRHASILCVNAGGPEQAIVQLQKLIKRHGYRLKLYGSVAYAQNWAQFFKADAPEENARQRVTGDETALAFAKDFTNGVFNKATVGFGTRLWSGFVAFMFGLVGRRLLGKLYIADERCTSCGYCVKTCPANTIHLSGKDKRPLWRGNCQSCNRCVNLCPAKAIQTSNLRMRIHLPVYLVLSLAAIGAGIAVGLVLSAHVSWYVAWAGGILGFLAASVLGVLIQFIVVDGIVNLLQRLFKKAFAKSFTKNFDRYCAPGFKPSVNGL